jgi:ribonuclease HI/dsDNA-binding SOS-regulon protein
LAETFDNLNRYKLKLNPTKCSFGVSAGQLLGFLVSARGIEANPEKIQAILTMGKSTKLHDVQKLAERVAALSRFVARLGEKALPFYALMKKSDDKFEWMEEADVAFAQLKKVLSTPPVLVAPNEKEPLLLYIAATHQVMSTVLVVERSEERKAHGVQRPVYFVSEVLSPIKQRYPHYQKLTYSVFTTARKLWQYFAVHPIIVVNKVPLSNILNNPSATGRISLWGIELSPLDITYEKRKAIKSQVLPDFTAEWLELQNTGPPNLSSVWTMYFDGSKRIQGARAEVVLISPQGDKLKYVLRMSFPQASNNEAEYEVLLHRMKMAKACGATRLKIFGDSNLVVQQVMNKCDAISDNMTAYRNLYYYLEGTFDGCEVSHISRASNEEANNLANIGSQCLPIPQGVFWEEIIERLIKSNKASTTEEQGQHQATSSGAGKTSIAEPEEVMMIEETWMQPYLAYMINKTLPEDTVEAKRIIRQSNAFVVLQGKLYKKSISGVLQRCVTPQEGQEILKDIHTGVCGHHASSRIIAAKAFHAGFYWLTAIEDVKDIVRKCEACQRFASRPHAPVAELQPIPLSWPFAQRGLDMVGKLHKSWPGGHVYMLVAVDKFTKWVEAALVTTQDSTAAINFIKSIVFRFGVPHSIITDNGTNFTSKEFKNYCEGLRIKLKFASVAHPKTNG